MRYHALACDYDGTIAWDGEVSEDTILALQEVRKSGRKLILVTGRELDDLIKVFLESIFLTVLWRKTAPCCTAQPHAKNGLLLTGRPTSSGSSSSKEAPIEYSVGRVIVATWRPHEKTRSS